jgi:hypothetical protein
MKTAAVLVVLAGVVGCGASSTPPASSPSSDSSEGSASGATSKQGGKDEGNRKLTHEECLSLGESIKEACSANTRSAQYEAWCSDVVSGLGAGTWVDGCEKHIRYMDAVCFTSNPGIRSMMDCDSAVQK